MEQERDTVRVTHEECDFWIVGGDDVGLERLLGEIARIVSVDNVRAVDQPNVVDGSGIASERVERTDAVRAHVDDVISHAPADVERIPRRGADASLTREDRVSQSRETLERKIADTVFMMKGHDDCGAEWYSAQP